MLKKYSRRIAGYQKPMVINNNSSELWRQLIELWPRQSPDVCKARGHHDVQQLYRAWEHLLY
jgi:hypothetical protein